MISYDVFAFQMLCSSPSCISCPRQSMKCFVQFESKMAGNIQTNSKWRKSVDSTFATKYSKADLLILSRSSFSSTSYFEDLLKNMEPKNDGNYDFVLLFGALMYFNIFILPQLNISVTDKNSLGLLLIAFPFLLLLTETFLPNFRLVQRIRLQFSPKELQTSDRLLYHEAGHVLVGYLLGISISSYASDNLSSAYSAVDIDKIFFTNSLNEQVKGNKLKNEYLPTISVAHLLVVSMAGVVAESLQFKDSYGGVEDLILAKQLLSSINISDDDRIGYLRWAVGKALTILRLNRKTLDNVATAMKSRKSIQECYEIIEATVE